MKKIGLSLIFATLAMMMASCTAENNQNEDDNNDYRIFVGTWGLKQIDYYYVDYFGQPVEEGKETYYFTPGDTKDGIDLVFKSDKTGVRIDRNNDTVFLIASVNPIVYDTIICPDTVLYFPFTYSYDEEEKLLFLTYPDQGKTYTAKILHFDEQSFRYYNQYKLYDRDYAEDALLERISDTPSRVAPTRHKVHVPRKPGSFLFDK